MRRFSVPFAIGVLSFASEARAEKQAETAAFILPGYLYSHVMGASPAEGHGVEVSCTIFPAGSPVAVGAFAQWQRYNGDHTRYAGGVQAIAYIPGIELGWARREGAFGEPRVLTEGGPSIRPYEGATSGLHVAPFLSLGFLSIAYRWTIPLGNGSDVGHGGERALTVALKLPLQIYGPSIYQAIADGFRGFAFLH